MKTATTQKPKATDYREGEELLRKAVALEKESSQTYGEWVLWIKDGNVSITVVTEQICNVKSIDPGRMSGQVPQNIAMTTPITIHGVSADRAGAVGDEVVKAMQDPSRRLLAQLKKSRSDEQRLNFDFA